MRNSVVVCLVAYAAATGRPLGNRLAELVHQDPLNEEKLDKMLSLIDDAEEMNLAHPGNGMTALHARAEGGRRGAPRRQRRLRPRRLHRRLRCGYGALIS